MRFGRFRIFVTGIFCIFLFSSLWSFAQGDAAGQPDFTYEKRHIEERNVTPYPPLRQADVMYSRRIHRVLDTREKQNLGMKWKKNPFSCIVFDAVMKDAETKSLTPYKNDSISSFFSRSELIEQITEAEQTKVPVDPINQPGVMTDTTLYDTTECEEIHRFRIMEDWVFDKETSEFFPRIIAIAPLQMKTRDGIELGLQPLFWVEWKELRKILVNEPMFNRHNDAAQLSYYDFFEQRLFSSYIVKEPNELDQDIGDLPKYDGDKFGALIRAKEIEEELFNFEHDLWEY